MLSRVLLVSAALLLAGFVLARAGLRHSSPQLSSIAALQMQGNPIQGRVISVPRGDLLLVRLDQQDLKLRLCGIDVSDSRRPDASNAEPVLQNLIGQTVRIQPVRQQSDYLIAEVFPQAPPKQPLSQTLVADGLAYLYPAYVAECPTHKALEQSEAEAKAHRRGIWANSQTSSQPKPWEIRRASAAKQLNQFYQQWLDSPQMPKSAVPQIDPNYLHDGMQATRLGLASWYGPVLQGHPTANGEIFDQKALTAAHASLPFNSRLKVMNLNNGKSTIVRINDRQPTQMVSLDLSKAAAQQLGSVQSGVVPVEIELLPSPLVNSSNSSSDR